MANVPVPDDYPTRVMVSPDLNGQAPWLDPAEPVSVRHVARAAAHHSGGTADVAERLAGLGYRLPSAEDWPRSPTTTPGCSAGTSTAAGPGSRPRTFPGCAPMCCARPVPDVGYPDRRPAPTP